MRLLCIYDPAIILPVPHDWPAVMAARDVFEEHNAAQDFFGFKVAITEILQLALAGVPNGTPATSEGMAIALLGYLTGPERNQRFHFVVIDDTTPAFSSESDTLCPHSPNQDIQDVYADLRHLLGWCEENHPGKARYATMQHDETDETNPGKIVGTEGEHIPIVRNRYEWGEAYRRLRKPPANLLPNTFMLPSAEEPTLAFCPPEGFLEDEQDLPRPPLPKRPRWRNVGGNPRGYRDRWENFWMWNRSREHWDVQITERVRGATGAPDWHLNVECAEARAHSDNTLLEGRIIEGFKPDPNVIGRFSIWELP